MFYIRPAEKAQHIPDKLNIRNIFVVDFDRSVIQLIRVSLDLFQQLGIAIPLQEIVGPFRWRRLLHRFYKRESNTYVSCL
jgi:hypothetical protein